MRKIRHVMLIGLLACCGLITSRPARGYTTSHCIMGTLYIDFYSADGMTYQGYMKIDNAAQCQ
jgi:hypothetical protein